MKKLYLPFLVIVFCLLLSACGASEGANPTTINVTEPAAPTETDKPIPTSTDIPLLPDDTVEEFFDASQELKLESMASLIAPSNTEDIDRTASLIEEQQEDYPDFLIDYLKTNADKITYEITESVVSGDKAVVTVNCEYVDSGPILLATVGEVLEKLFEQIFNGVEMTDEETDELFSTVMQEQIEVFEESFTTVTLNIDLIKIEDAWYLAETSDELLDVVMSGFISAGNEISDSFSSNDGGENY